MQGRRKCKRYYLKIYNYVTLFIGSKDDNEESDQEESDHESKSITSCGMCAYN